MANDRNESIDAVKGLCLLHMLLLHLSIIYGTIDFEGNGAGLYFHLMEFFMIPFYLFSGYFFSKKLNFKEFFKHKAHKLLLPLLFWSCASLPIYYFYQYYTIGDIQWGEPFKMFLSIGCLYSDSPLWFLFSLFFVNIIFYFASMRLKKEKYLFGFIVLCFLYACLDRYYLPCYLSSSNISLGLVYFYIGYRIRKANQTKVLNPKILVMALAIFVIISIFNPQWMQIVTLTQTEGLFTFNLLFALSGTYILWYLFSLFPKTSIFSYFGRNSMTYYVWHMIPLRMVFDPIVKEHCPQMPCWQYIAVGGGIILITGWIIDRYAGRCCPALIGK